MNLSLDPIPLSGCSTFQPRAPIDHHRDRRRGGSVDQGIDEKALSIGGDGVLIPSPYVYGRVHLKKLSGSASLEGGSTRIYSHDNQFLGLSYVIKLLAVASPTRLFASAG